jgi:hypothetical protein
MNSNQGLIDTSAKRVAMAWAAAFVIGMFGMPAVVRFLAIPSALKMVLTLLPMLFLIPMVSAAGRAARQSGCYSAALQNYNRRMLIWSFAYVIALFVAVWAHNDLHPTGILAWALAVAPALPILFFIWSMGAYLSEEKDEYLRQRSMVSALWATGILLTVATFYGFLDTFQLVPHVEGWAAVPLWAIGLAVGNLIARRS